MKITRLEGDFSPVEIRGYNSKSRKTYSDYAVIASDEAHKIIAIGKEAYKYIDAVERTAMGEVSVYSTFKRNVVAEFEETVAVVKLIFKEILIGAKNKIFKPTVVVCIPFELTGVETRAFQEVFIMAGAKNVIILERDFEDNKRELANNYSIVIGIIPNKL
ncbi:MAG: rod shape-determining protein [Velocimicrobium sp.]